MSGPRIDHYDWTGGREAMLRFGPDDGPVVVVAMPLFEEANRTRAFVVAILRALAERGIAGALPDIPGQGESLVPLEDLSLLDMAEGYSGAVDRVRGRARRVYGLAVRSGVLIDRLGRLDGRWHLASQGGPDLLREMTRIGQVASRTMLSDPQLPARAPSSAVEIAGNRIGPAVLTDLSVCTPWSLADGGSLRTVRLNGDPRPADRHVAGSPLWRRSEPDNDPALAVELADDIAGWIERCGG